MNKYKIEIREFLSAIIDVEAENVDIAISIVKEKYRNEEIVLDSYNYVSTEIKEIILNK